MIKFSLIVGQAAQLHVLIKMKIVSVHWSVVLVSWHVYIVMESVGYTFGLLVIVLTAT